MANLLKADGNAGDAYVQKAFGSESALWVTIELRFDADLIASEDGGDLGYGPNFLDMLRTGSADQGVMTNAGGAGEVGVSLTYQSPFTTLGAPIAADDVHLVELHLVGGSPHAATIYVDTVNLGIANTSHNVADWDAIRLGVLYTYPDPRQVYVFDSVKVGTSRGGSELFGDDFESGNLSAWDSQSGDVSVISEGAAPPDPIDLFRGGPSLRGGEEPLVHMPGRRLT